MFPLPPVIVVIKFNKLNTAVVPLVAQADSDAPFAIGRGSIVIVWVQVLNIFPSLDTTKVTVTDPFAAKKPLAPGIKISCTGPMYEPDEDPDITAFAVLEVMVN